MIGTALAVAGMLAGPPSAPVGAVEPVLGTCPVCGRPVYAPEGVACDDCDPPEPGLWPEPPPLPPADRARLEAAARKDARRRLRRLRDAERRGEELVPWQAAVLPVLPPPGEGA
jgi:hypothetical protein